MDITTRGYGIFKADKSNDDSKKESSFALLIVDDLYEDAFMETPVNPESQLIRHVAQVVVSNYHEMGLIILSDFGVKCYSELETYIKACKLLCIIDYIDSDACRCTIHNTWKIPKSQCLLFTHQPMKLFDEKEYSWISKVADDSDPYGQLERKVRGWLDSILNPARDIWQNENTDKWFASGKGADDGGVPHTAPQHGTPKHQTAKKVLKNFFKPLFRWSVPEAWFEMTQWEAFHSAVKEMYGTDRAPRRGGRGAVSSRGLALLAVLAAPGLWIETVDWSAICNFPQVLPNQKSEQAQEACQAFYNMIEKLAYHDTTQTLQLLQMVGDGNKLCLYFNFRCDKTNKGAGHDPLLKQVIDHSYTGDSGKAIQEFLKVSCIDNRDTKQSWCVINMYPLSDNRQQTILEIRPCKEQ